MRNISWCPCLNTRLNFYLGINFAAQFTVRAAIHSSTFGVQCYNGRENFHTLLSFQAGIHSLPKKTLLRKLEESKTKYVPHLRKLRLDDFIFHSIILVCGSVVSIITFAFELGYSRLKQVVTSRKTSRWRDATERIQLVCAFVLFVPSMIVMGWSCFVFIVNYSN